MHNKSRNLLAYKMMEIFSSSQSLLLSLIPCTILFIFLCLKWVSFHFMRRKNLPPSPMKLPIIGNFHQLGSNPNRSLQKMSQKYGPIMLLHLGSMPTLVASSAAAAEELLKTHDLTFCNRPDFTMPNILFYNCKSVSFSQYGEYWRQLKSITVLKLLSNARVKSYQKVREDEISHMIRVIGESRGTPIDVSTLLVSLTNNIISRVALGRKYDGVEHLNLVKRFMHMLTVFSVGSYIPWLSWVDHINGSIGRAEKVAKEFDEFIEKVIEEHVNKKKSEDGKSDEEEDFVDILLDVQKDNTMGFTLDRDSLKGLILETFVGGTHNTSTSLEWAISEIIRNPRVMKKVQQEVSEIAQGRSMISEEDLEKLPYLKAALKEAFRMHIPAPLLGPRKTMQDVKVMGYDIPAGTQGIINAWALGRDPDLWKDANEFRPERFLSNSINYQTFQFEWLPFGAGRRMCPGINFSLPSLELTLANIFYKFDISLPNGKKNEDLDMSEVNGITIQRKYPLLVLVNPRF